MSSIARLDLLLFSLVENSATGISLDEQKNVSQLAETQGEGGISYSVAQSQVCVQSRLLSDVLT